jgi:putative tricarboxylic transport membrane protein
MFAGIYYGGMYGGSTTSILLNTPGESASIVTALEGNKMARAGRGGPALATAAIGSFVAGLIATLGLAFIAPWVVKFALAFGPREYFALMVLAFVTVSAAFGDSHAARPHRAVHRPRARPGRHRPADRAGAPDLRRADLIDGIEVTTLAVACSPSARRSTSPRRASGDGDKVEAVKGSVWMTREDWARSWKPWLRGTPSASRSAPCRPAAPRSPASSYSTEKRFSKHKEEFGKGAIEGVAGPEAANNASAAGTLVPLLTLGLPTTATAAIMLAGFQQYGLQPGPLLFASNPQLVWGLIASLLIAN